MGQRSLAVVAIAACRVPAGDGRCLSTQGNGNLIARVRGLVQVVRGDSPQNTSIRNHGSTHPLQDGCPFAGKLGCRRGTAALEACEARVANEARIADAAGTAATDSSCGHGLGGIQ